MDIFRILNCIVLRFFTHFCILKEIKTAIMENIQFRELHNEDMEFVKSIYEYYVENSTATFHTGTISIDELKEFIFINHSVYKSFIIIYNNQPVGYCYFNQYKKRQAYDRTAEVTLYIDHAYHGKGIGLSSMQYIETIAREAGLKNLLGIITGENTPSINLFEKCGYEKCAHFKNIGEKFNRLLDVVAFQKEI